MAIANGTHPSSPTYNVVTGSQSVFKDLLFTLALPPAVVSEASCVNIEGPSLPPPIPCPWRETEAITAIKALEAAVALSLANIRFPNPSQPQTASVSTDHACLSLFQSYLSTVAGYGKWDKRSLPYLRPTDIHQAQSNLYRRLSANMYQTKEPGRYYHTHGSLQATPILNALGLPGFLEPDVEDYDRLCEIVQAQTMRFTSEELDEITVNTRQAGAMCLKEEDFFATEQGRAMREEPPIKTERIGDQPPAKFGVTDWNGTVDEQDKLYLLKGIKVLDLTRVIAGPSISRTLAEYGASVLKVTSPHLPDVPWYAVDLNFGKRTTELDLRNPTDREMFEKLLDEDGGVDLIVDGYRPGAFDRLGYGFESLKKRWQHRVGPWKERSGWQPIADAVSGLAWGHGPALGLDEPVLPPFPMSDYGTGALGAVGALLALFRRATEGGSYKVDASLVGWNLFVQGLGMYPDELWKSMLRKHRPELQDFKVGHLSNFDVVSKAAIKSMRRLSPRLFDEQYLFEMDCPGFKAQVKSMRPVVQYSNIKTGFENGRESRPNGFDPPSWRYDS